MKKTFYIFIFFISILYPAQHANAFGEPYAEEVNTSTRRDAMFQSGELANESQASPVTAKCCGNPGDPVPIDDYLPLLVITAIGFIVYHQYRKRPSL